METHRFFLLECWLKMLYRRGRRYRHHTETLARSRKYSPAELAQYQNFLLRQMVDHCARYVPYYGRLFRELGLRAEEIRTVADLEKIPILDKNTVQQHLEEFVSRKHRDFLCRIGSTSGSTGRPARFLRDFDSINFEHAIIWRQWREAGDIGKKRISLRGDLFVPSSRTKPPFWRYNPLTRDLQMSSYHLSPRTSRYYIDKILEFQPDILYCGPSMGYALAKFFRLHQVDYPFEAIFTTSESLDESVRDYLETVFRAPVYDWYGQAERVAAIAQCRNGIYHIQEDYSVVELIPKKDPEKNAPILYEVVGTQLHNTVMPLLRYQTQDYVSLPESEEVERCRCGSAFRRVERIVGRDYGYLLTPEGYHIAITAHIPCGVEHIIETQFHQEKPGEVLIKVVASKCLSDTDRYRLIEDTLRYTSPRMKVFVEEVPDIPRGPNGKFVNIINRLPLPMHQIRERPLEPVNIQRRGGEGSHERF